MTDRPRVTALLRRDHDALRALVDRLTRARTPEAKQSLVDELERVLVRHARAEQPVFRVAVVAAEAWSSALLVEVEAQEHVELHRELRRLGTLHPWHPTFADLVGVVARRILLHLCWEEEEVFTEVSRRLSDQHLRDLGAELSSRTGESTAG